MSRSPSRWLLLAFVLTSAPGSVFAQTMPAAAVPPPPIAAKAYVLVDTLSGQTLVAQGADEPREPASLTKLMTAYIAFRALKDKELTLADGHRIGEGMARGRVEDVHRT